MQLIEALPDTAIFEQELNATFTLEVDGEKGEVVASSIQEIDIKLHPYGYEAYLSFVLFDDDKVHILFAKEKVINATLTFKSTDPKKKGTPVLELKGIVGNRSFHSVSDGSSSDSWLYKVHFTDPAKISWGTHFPMKIFVDQTMKDVLDAEKNPLISIKYDWEPLNEVSPILAYSLEFRNGLPMSKQVSFYSFLTWYLYQFNGILEYSYKENSYSIVGKKTEEGAPIPIAEWIITPAVCKFPDSPRYQVRSVKHSPDNLDNTDEENPNGFQGVRKDGFDEASYRQFPEQVFQTVQSKLFPEKPSIRFSVIDFFDPFDLGQLVPGKLIEIKENQHKGGVWCEDHSFKGKIFRITDISFKALTCSTYEQVTKPVQPFKLEIEISAESKDETYVPRPEFQSPAYPFSIPGKIFSEIGDKEQTTFNVVKDDKAPLGQYQVKVPLAGDDKKVVVPFTPDFISGQHYFPLCKDQQVMLSMYFQTAKIERVLDWQPLTRLPLDTQANQIVFASNGKDKYFVQKHEFKGGKDSVLIIKQSSSQDQTQTIQIQEKEITITVEEKGKNTVLIQLNRESGLTLKLKDDASGVTQQSVYDAKAITHTSEGKDGKSTIVQKPDSVSVKCKTFNVKCDEAVIDADKTITNIAANKIILEAPTINEKGAVKMG